MCALLWVVANIASAQNDRDGNLEFCDQHGWEFTLKAGVGIGGFSPLPLPAEIREVKNYTPLFSGSFEGQITKWLDRSKKWGVSLGIRLEDKGMSTCARVKNYRTEIIEGSDRVAGYWTGEVKTKIKSSYLTLPLLANYQVNNRWKVALGPYLSFRSSGSFDGYVYEGYLREETPIGTKAEFRGGKTAMYDFSEHLRRFQWGVQASTTWQAYQHLGLYAQLTWGLNDIFHSEFKTITFNMYPIFLNLGFSYDF